MDVRLAAQFAGAATEPRPAARDSTQTEQALSSPAAQVPVSSDSAAADTVRTTPSGQFYISPILTFDSRALTVIFQVRDSESGDVTRQFPSETVVERYRRDPSARPFVLPEPAASEEQETGPPPPTIGGPVAEAANEAEARGETLPGPTPPGPSPQGASPTGGDAGAQQPAAPPRAPVDLVT